MKFVRPVTPGEALGVLPKRTPMGFAALNVKPNAALKPSSADSVEADEPDGDYVVDIKDRVAYLTQKLKEADADPMIEVWRAAIDVQNRNGAQARERLLKPETFPQLSDEQARIAASNQGYYFRHFGPSQQRRQSIEAYKLLAKRFPKDTEAAMRWLGEHPEFAWNQRLIDQYLLSYNGWLLRMEEV